MYSRTALLIGVAGVEKLKKSAVAVIGLGGVGGYVAEALARAGVGRLLLCDGDTVNESNINRQIIALRSTIGQKKAEVAAKRILDINPDIKIDVFSDFINKGNIECFNLCGYDYVADAIDSIAAKADLIEYCFKSKIRIISSMGAGNRLIPKFEAADIYSTHTCALAKTMRAELKQRGVTALKTVFSPAPPAINSAVIGSISFVPSVAGLTIASEIVNDLLI